MRLMDMATVHVGNGDGHWMKGTQVEDRLPGLTVDVGDVCGVWKKLIKGDTAKIYEIRPFAVRGRVPRSLTCRAEDDERWLAEAIKDLAERAFGLALCFEHAVGSESWIGSPHVATVAVGADGRAMWMEHNIGTPFLHVSDSRLPELMADHTIIVLPSGDLQTIWGDPVVNSPGYLAGVAFWSGPIDLWMSSIDTDVLVRVHTNDAEIMANMIGLIDASPFQIVRIGAVPAAPAAAHAQVAAPPMVPSQPITASRTAPPPLTNRDLDHRVTGVSAGSPGAFVGGTNIPDSLADLVSTGITPSPTTAWTATQHVVLEDGSKAHWDGKAWVAGPAGSGGTNPGTNPAPPPPVSSDPVGTPDDSWTKSEIIGWLTAGGMAEKPLSGLTKAALLALVEKE